MWTNPQFPADLVTFTEEILNGKFHFLCSEYTRKLLFFYCFSGGIWSDHCSGVGQQALTFVKFIDQKISLTLKIIHWALDLWELLSPFMENNFTQFLVIMSSYFKQKLHFESFWFLPEAANGGVLQKRSP